MFISALKSLGKALSKQKPQTTEACFQLVGFGGIFEADNVVLLALFAIHFFPNMSVNAAQCSYLLSLKIIE